MVHILTWMIIVNIFNWLFYFLDHYVSTPLFTSHQYDFTHPHRTIKVSKCTYKDYLKKKGGGIDNLDYIEGTELSLLFRVSNKDEIGKKIIGMEFKLWWIFVWVCELYRYNLWKPSFKSLATWTNLKPLQNI